ncbi:MAG: FAD-dependent oxidoreductase [Bdellovibrionales bacterium]|nr:FAD-dependent oxidoreductase [Bdellovibrionales bacterium]
MNNSKKYESDVVIAGGGLAGLTTAYELLDHDKKILILEKGIQQDLGGQAKESFGGVHMIGTPHQKRLKIKDTPELAYRDWTTVAGFGGQDRWPMAWARFYCENSKEYIFDFLDSKKISFLPILNWAERGLHKPGNTVPRWHVIWGTGNELIEKLLLAIEAHPNRANLEILFGHDVSGFEIEQGRVTGIHGKIIDNGIDFRATASCVVIASGGICGGDLTKLRENWYKDWGTPPRKILNGGFPYSDGKLHDQARSAGANVTHLDKQWHYAAGVHHPRKRRPDDGLSLVPPRSALWMNACGERIGPIPLVSNTDGRFLVETITRQPGQYSWQILNWKIAAKELAVSGSDYMTAFRTKNKRLLVQNMLFGNHHLVERLVRECPEDFVVADSLSELMDKMDERSIEGYKINREQFEKDIREYDDQITRGRSFHNDEQLRWISTFRKYRGDKIRVCDFQKILDRKAFPLIAIREFILSRKSLGGIQTDLQSRVLRGDGSVIPGLYAVGEAAGFGGGGIHGLGALEGTFLGSCVLTGRVAGRTIAGA